MDWILLWRLSTLHLSLATIIVGFKCPPDDSHSKSTEILRLCERGIYTGSSLVLDFSLAKELDLQNNECVCNAHIFRGKRVSMNPVDTPDYNGCGTEIWIQDAQTNNAHIITCRGGTQIPNLSPGSHLVITHKKLNPPYDSNYCYRFEVDGMPASDMMVICDRARVVTTTTEITTTTATPNITTEIPSSSYYSSPTPWSSMGTIAVVLGFLLCTAIVVGSISTTKYFRLKRMTNKKEEIYEEIHTIERPSIMKRPSMPLPPINESGKSNKASPSKKQSDIKDRKIMSFITEKFSKPIPQEEGREGVVYEPIIAQSSVKSNNHWNMTYSDEKDDTLNSGYTYVNDSQMY